MSFKWLPFFCGLLLLTVLSCRPSVSPIPLSAGLHLTHSVTIQKDSFFLDPLPGDSAVITISGDNIVIDFNGAVLKSNSNVHQPDQFRNWGIRILNGKNIELRNVHIHGYQGAIWASHCDSLQITHSELTYLYRLPQNIPATPTNKASQIGFTLNSKTATLPPAAGIYLDHCKAAVLKDLMITRAQNGILLNDCSNAIIYNNTLQFNTGIGIAIDRSDHNWVSNNRLDWNAVGIQIGANCRANTIAYNSATHTENGMVFSDSSSNQQLIFGNDFSHAVGKGVLLSGSNNFVYNRLEDCAIAVVEQEVHHSLIVGNCFIANDRDVQSEEADSNLWQYNEFEKEVTYATVAEYAPTPLVDGRDAQLAEGSLRGRPYRLMERWGPYDFREPAIWLRQQEGRRYTFVVLGPSGNWKLTAGKGFDYISPKSGTIPTTIVADQIADADSLAMELLFLGEAVQTIFGENIPRGAGVNFSWTQ